MRDAGLVLLLFGGPLALVVRLWSIARARRLARDRLDLGRADRIDAEGQAEDAPPALRPVLGRHRWVAWALGGGVLLVVALGVRLDLSYSVMFGLVAGMVAHEAETTRADRRAALVQKQLAEAIDLMVASLRAGASLLSSFETALGEARSPLRGPLAEVLGRIRYGADPAQVYEGLMGRVPLETFRLFAAALTVHHEVGGSLAPTLATVGRIVRDRLELDRRIRSMTIQSKGSTVAIMGITYFLGLLMWRTDPPRMEEFLRTTVGGALVSGAISLQFVGILWTSWLSRLHY